MAGWMSGFSGFGKATTASAEPEDNPNRDAVVPGPPADTVSCLRWSPAGPFASLLCSSSWNREIRIWDVVANTGQAIPKTVLKQPTPVLCCDWQHGSPVICAGACDGTVKQIAMDSTTMQFGEHAAPVKALVWNKTINAAITGSWDKTIALFDPRKATHVASNNDFKSATSARVGGLSLSERVHAMDNRDEIVAVATADRKVTLYDLRNLQTKIYDTPFLDKTSTAIALFPDKKSFALSSVEGRVAIQYIDPAVASEKNFKFKCHRIGHYDAYAVNAMATGVYSESVEFFVTGGSDGTFAFWNKQIKKRLFLSKPTQQPLTALAFNHKTSILAYATGYDWSKGAEYADKAKPPKIFLHGIDRSEIIPPT